MAHRRSDNDERHHPPAREQTIPRWRTGDRRHGRPHTSRGPGAPWERVGRHGDDAPRDLRYERAPAAGNGPSPLGIRGVHRGYHGGLPQRPLYGERAAGRFGGRGPRGYRRSDERIREDVCDRLTMDEDVDATDITVAVNDGEVTLEGTVLDRRMKRDAEDCADEVMGVREIHNRLHTRGPNGLGA